MRLLGWLLVLLWIPAAAETVTLELHTRPPGLHVWELKADGGLAYLCRADRPYLLKVRPGQQFIGVQFGYYFKPANQDIVQIRLDEASSEVHEVTLHGWSWLLYELWEDYFPYALAAGLALLLVVYFKVVAPSRRRALHRSARRQRLRELRAGFDPQDRWLGHRFGAYRLVQRLGAGGMAAVYRALDDSTLEEREPVAVKVMHTQGSPEAEERFRREARVCAQLNHPNLVRILDAGDQDGVLYLAMELVQGRTLRADRGASPTRVLQIFRMVFAGVRAAHSLAIVHRDLKPDNVMLSDDGRVVVMDFGLARRSDLATITATGSVMGTPAYMAPEQIRGEAVDARADQYALGVMLYEMLAGTLPFDGELDPLQLIMKQLGEEPIPLRQRRPELSSELEAAVMRMLRKVPGERFPTLDAAWEALSKGVPEEDPGPVRG